MPDAPHRYMTLACGLEKSTVESVGEDYKEDSLSAYFEAFPEGIGEKIEAIRLETRHVAGLRQSLPRQCSRC